MLKKFLICFLIICFSLPVVSFADEEKYSQEIFDKAASALCALEVTEDILKDDYKPFELVTRAEFAELCFRLLTGNNVGMFDNGFIASGFSDVPDDYWAQNYIAFLKQMNIVSGEEGGVFLPDESITFEQAVAMIVKLLGYETHAQASGGYSSGYIIEANKLRLLAGINSSFNEKLNRAEMAILGYNALSVELCTQSNNFNGTITTYLTGETLLSSAFHLEKHTGTVMATECQTIAGGNLLPGQILIDGIVFASGMNDIHSYVGKKVSVYFESENDLPYVKAIFEEENTIYEFKKHQIDRLTTSYVTVKTDNSNGEKDIKIADNAIWSINNQHCRKALANTDIEIEFFNKTELTSEEEKDLFSYVGAEGNENPDINGYISLYDTNNDNSFDIVRIYYFQSFVVREAKADDSSLVLKNPNGTLRTVDTANVSAFAYRNGKVVSLDEISADDSVSVCYAKNITGETVISIYANKSDMSGTVSEISYDGGVVIGSVIYYITPGVKNLISVGKNMIFYTDLSGYIFAVKTDSESGIREGYLVKSGMSNGIDKNLELLIYDEYGLSKYTAKEKIRYGDGSLNDFSLKTAEAAYNILNGKSQLVRYQVNDEGLISEIQTAYEKTTRYDTADFVKDYEIANYSHSSKYRINNKYLIDSTTKVYFVPASGEEYSELYAVGGYLDMVLHSVFDKIEIYSAEGYVAKKIVVTYNPDSAQPTVRYANACIVTSVQVVLNNSGKEIMVELLEKGVKKIFYAVPGMKSINDCDNNFKYGDTPVEQLKKGDVIQIVRVDDRLSGFRILSRLSDLGTGKYFNVTNSNPNPPADTFDHIYIGYGKIKDVYPKALIFNANPGQTDEFDRVMLAENTMYVYKVNKRSFNVEQTTFSKVRADDEVVVRITSNKVLEMFILQ